MSTLDTQEGQKAFATRMAALVQEFGGETAVWMVADRRATPLAFGAAGTTADGARELLCRAIYVSYDCDGEPVYQGDGISMLG
jgi:hypothetical protein